MLWGRLRLEQTIPTTIARPAGKAIHLQPLLSFDVHPAIAIVPGNSSRRTLAQGVTAVWTACARQS